MLNFAPHRKFDQFIPIRPFANQGGHKYPEEYEHRLIKALRKWSGADDRVVIVGGGLGVTSVVAARKVGENGQVITFEGAKDMAEIARETVRLNAVDERVTVKHAIVGSALQLAGEAGGADCVSPEEIPDSDILELDCEGAEVDILKNISTRPRAIIDETHNNIEKVRQVLEGGLCYDIVSEEIAEIGPYTDMCERNDICVIVATD